MCVCVCVCLCVCVCVCVLCIYIQKALFHKFYLVCSFEYFDLFSLFRRLADIELHNFTQRKYITLEYIKRFVSFMPAVMMCTGDILSSNKEYFVFLLWISLDFTVISTIFPRPVIINLSFIVISCVEGLMRDAVIIWLFSKNYNMFYVCKDFSWD